MSYRLRISIGHIVIPLIYAGQDMPYPQRLAASDLHALERLCLEAIADHEVAQLRIALTPAWREKPRASAA